MIDVDTSKVPTGVFGMTRLLEAVYAADPADETEWVEFKAGTDPTSVEGKAAVAKAIVAFANRTPERAATWFEGYSFIILGLEPGKCAGAPARDPAQIHDAIQPLLADPAPEWEVSPITFRDTHIIVITVSPPRPGDPIHCIAKSTGKLVDGHVYVRRPGKSEHARSADFRALGKRSMQGLAPELDIEVTAEVAGGLRPCRWSADWIDRWVQVEKTRLLGPMEIALDPPAAENTLAMLRTELSKPALMGAAFDRSGPYGDREVPEDRTEEEYRDAVGQYLDSCREALVGAEVDAASALLEPVVWTVTNLTEHNLHNVEIRVHVEGDVRAFESLEPSDFSLEEGLPARPRVWGPRTIPGAFSKAAAQMSAAIHLPTMFPQLPPTPSGGYSGPTFENGGSVTVEFLAEQPASSRSRRVGRHPRSVGRTRIRQSGSLLLVSHSHECLWCDKQSIRHSARRNVRSRPVPRTPRVRGWVIGAARLVGPRSAA